MILFTGSGAVASAFEKLYPCKIISARLMDDKALATHINSAEVVIHNAAIIKGNDLSEYIAGNFVLTKRIIDLIKITKPQIKFFNISSMSILKNDENYLTADNMSDYAFSKYISELYCLREPVKQVCNVRFSTIFYDDYNRDGLSKLIYDSVKYNKVTIYNNGAAQRDFIPLSICAQYLYKLTQLEKLPLKINIVTGRSTSFFDFVSKLKAANPTLIVENIISETTEVLHSFSKKGIDQLGEIDFTIEYFVERYFTYLNENPDF